MKNDLKELLEYIDGKLMRLSKPEPNIKPEMMKEHPIKKNAEENPSEEHIISTYQEDAFVAQRQQSVYNSKSNSKMDLNLSEKWSSPDDDKLIYEYDQRKTIKDLANMFQVDVGFIRTRLKMISINEERIE